MPGFLSDPQLKAAVANVLQLDVGTMPPFWDDIITKANVAAYQDIYAGLIERGFTVAVVNSWDRGAEFQADLGMYWALLRGGAMGQYGEGFKGLDRRKELKDVMVTVGGIWQQPGGPVTAQEQPFDEVNTGAFGTSADNFSLDTTDPRIGLPTKW